MTSFLHAAYRLSRRRLSCWGPFPRAAVAGASLRPRRRDRGLSRSVAAGGDAEVAKGEEEGKEGEEEGSESGGVQDEVSGGPWVWSQNGTYWYNLVTWRGTHSSAAC